MLRAAREAPVLNTHPSNLVIRFAQVLEDPAAWDEAVMQTTMLGALRAQMAPQEAAVLDKVRRGPAGFDHS
jgi:hypothetical protein